MVKSAERVCMIAARSEGVLADFVLLFVLRWALKALGLAYVYYQPVLSQVHPPLQLSDLKYPLSTLFNGAMFFASGLPELVFAGIWIAYSIIALTLFGRTLGMRQAGLILLDSRGGRPAFWRILTRQLAAPVSSIAWVGYWFMMFSPSASALHDYISGTHIAYVTKRMD